MAYIGKRPQDTFPAGNAVTSTIIAENAVGSSEIATNAVSTLQIADNAVTGVKIAENGITSRELAANTIATGNIADNAIDSTKIAQNSILTKHIDDGQVTTDQILDGTIATGDLADDAVTTAKITDANVTTAKIADSNVTTAKIADDAVTTAKMASLARGAILVGDASGNPSALALGSNGLVLKSDGSDLVFAADSGLSSEQVQDIVGAMFSSNTETGITGTYQDSDGTIDLVVGTLNQDTTGNAATATALETARTIHGVSFDGSANIDLSEVVQDTVGAMFSGNTETNITATYQDSDGTIDLEASGTTHLNNTSEPAYHKITVTVVSDGGNKYALDGGTQAIAKLTPSVVYRFDQSDSSNSSHPLRIGTAANGSEISSGTILYNKVGTPGSAGAYTEVAFEQDAPGLLYYWCSAHSGMGSTISIADESALTQTLTNKTLTSPNITGLQLGGTTVTSTAAELNILDGVTSTAAELNIMDGDTSAVSTTLANADRVVVNDAGTMKQVALSDLATYMGDNVTINQTQTALTVSGNTTIGGNLTVNGTTTTLNTTNSVISDRLIELGNGTSGSPSNDMGIVMERGSAANAFMGFDESADKFIVGTGTFTGSSTGDLSITTGTLVANLEGAVTGNASTATALASARTIHGVSFDGTANIDLSEVISDTVGAMFSSNTETGITATYQDSDNTIDLVIGTLNQNTTGSAATLTNARTIGGVSFDGSANINLPGVNSAGNQNTTGSAATLTSARTIGGVSFDGSANINLPGVNAAGNQNTTGSAATLTTTRAIAVAGAVTGTANFDGSAGISITTTLANNAVLTQHIDDNQITSDQIADDAVGADQLAANSVVSASIVNGSIVSADIAANTIATSNVADNAIDATKIASNSILTRHIDDNQITGDQIADDIVLSGTGALRMPDGTTAQRPGSAAAGMFRYNTTLGKFEGYTDAWGEVGGGGSNGFLTDIFDGTTTPATDGSRVDFTMSQAVTDEKFVMVFIDGVYQAHAAYSVSGTTLTMADAPVAGRVLTVHTVSAAVQGDGLTINNFSGDGSDTTFTLNVDPTHENNTQVYIDGVYQFKNTYSVSGTTLTFSTAPPNGSGIEVMVHSQTTINSAGSLAAGAVSGLSEVTIAGADHIMLFDATDNALKKGLASDLIEQLTTEQVQDVVGAMVSSNTETGVAVSYEDGDGTLDFVLATAQPTVTSLGTLTTLTVDDITINGSTISRGGSGDLLFDVGGNIQLDADDNGEIRFIDGGTQYATIKKDGDAALFQSIVADGDFIIQGIDGSSFISAVRFDMSDAGTATFNNNILLGNTVTNLASGFADQTGIALKNSATVPEIQVSSDAAAMQLGRTSTGGSGQILALRAASTTKHSFTTTGYDLTGTLVVSGAATFNSGITATSANINGQLNVTNSNSNTISCPQVTNQFDTSSFMRFHPSATTNSSGYTNIFFGTDTANNFGVALGGLREGTNGKPSFAIRMQNDSISGTLALKIDNEGDLTIPGSSQSSCTLDVGRTGTSGQGAAILNLKSQNASELNFFDVGTNTIRLFSHSVNARIKDVPNNDDSIQFEAAGNIDIDGSYLTGGFDYAEYFESTDGTAIPVGTSVVLVNEKVRAATSGEQPLGVVRPGSDGTSVVGGSAGLRWTGKYLKDDYDAYLYDTVDYWTWKDVGDTNNTGDEDQQCWSDRVPSGWVVPSDKVVTSRQRKRLNPDFVENLDSNGEQIYVNRESRDEWNCIGLLGQVPITKGQVTNSNWTKLKDRSAAVELWFIK